MKKIKYNYWCSNPSGNCSLRQNQHIIKDESIAKKKEFCIECGSELKLLGTLGTMNFNGMSLMTKDQQAQVMKKRSHEHYKKHIEENKREMIRQYDSSAKQK